MSWQIAALFATPVFLVIWGLLSMLHTKRLIDRRHRGLLPADARRRDQLD